MEPSIRISVAAWQLRESSKTQKLMSSSMDQMLLANHKSKHSNYIAVSTRFTLPKTRVLRTHTAKQLRKLQLIWSNQDNILMLLPQAQVSERIPLQELEAYSIYKLSLISFKFWRMEPNSLGLSTLEMLFVPFQLVTQLEFWQSEAQTLIQLRQAMLKIIQLKRFKE